MVKLRAWNIDYKFMTFDFYVDANGVTFEKPAIGWCDMPNTEIEENPNLVVMRFTGMKDRHGVDIFEGDIVHSSHYVDNANHEVINIAEWGTWFMSGSDGYAETLSDEIGSIEIIGNIHQNPEMLETNDVG